MWKVSPQNLQTPRKKKHEGLDENHRQYAVNVSKIFSSNKNETKNIQMKSKPKRYKCTNVIKRKGNYKECLICKNL